MVVRIGPRKSIRHYIAEHREARNLTQAQLADRLECDVMTISRWENYVTKVTMDILQAIAEALDGNLEGEDLLYPPDRPSPNQLLRALPPEEQEFVLRTIRGLQKQG